MEKLTKPRYDDFAYPMSRREKTTFLCPFEGVLLLHLGHLKWRNKGVPLVTFDAFSECPGGRDRKRAPWSTGCLQDDPIPERNSLYFSADLDASISS